MICNEEKTPILSFFSGGGFMDMGFIEAGFSVVWTNEIDSAFSALYKDGITSWNNGRGVLGDHKISNQKSIRDIETDSIIEEAFNGIKPDHFGVIGGPPCQDFSINGNMEGFKGDRGSLTDAFLWKILELQPSFFVMENVTGLLKSKKTSKHFKDLLDLMRNDYMIDYEILNSINYGVPQSRERVFVVGIRNDLLTDLDIEINAKGKWFPFPNGNKRLVNNLKWPLVNDYGVEPEIPIGIPLNLCVDSCLVPIGDENKIANANEFFNLYVSQYRLNEIKEGETNRPSFKRLHRYRYSPTTCYGNNEVHLHPYQNRRLSVREALRIQGVADTYCLSPELPLSKKFKMIGNGVPVPLANVVACGLNDLFSRIKQLKIRPMKI